MPDNVQNATDLRLQIAEHQANLMRLAEAWGQHIVDALDEADRRTIARLQTLLEELKFERNTAAGMKQLERIRKEIEKIRVKAYANAEKKLRDEARALAKNESKWARRILFAFAGLSFIKSLTQPKQQEQQKWLEQYAKEHPLPEETETKPEKVHKGHKHRHKKLKVKRLAKPTQEQITKAANVKSSEVTSGLTDAETERVINRGVLQNKRWDEWWTHTADVDVQRVAEAVNEGINNGLTVEETTAIIRGTKAGNYEDGLLSKNRQDARRMARTILAGIANEAKEQFYQDNADVLLGVEWLDTLDGRTCFGCASLSRQQWKLDEPHPVPPLHPNCRCVLIPVTPLSALVDEERPAAKSDFMADARRAYEAKYPDKRFDDLAESTRKKYYYDAIKEYEQRTGQAAFEMVRGGVNFKEYFENVMTEQQRRDWLGPERYKLWQTGRYKFEDFVSPYPNRNVTVAELKKADIAGLEVGTVQQAAGQRIDDSTMVLVDGKSEYPTGGKYKKLKPYYDAAINGQDKFSEKLRSNALNREFAGVWDADGNLLCVSMGGDKEMNVQYIRPAAGATVIHNHPAGNTPSWSDFSEFYHGKMKKMKIITTQGDFTLTSSDEDGILKVGYETIKERFAERKGERFHISLEEWEQVLDGTGIKINFSIVK